MKFVKNYNLKGFWHRMELTDEEFKKVMKSHRLHCKQIYKECQTDAKALLSGRNIKSQAVLDLANTLLFKRALQLYTMIQAELDNKIMKKDAKARANNYSGEDY